MQILKDNCLLRIEDWKIMVRISTVNRPICRRVCIGLEIMDLKSLAQSAKKAANFLSAAGAEQKNKALGAIAKALKQNSAQIIKANQQDLEKAKTENLAAPLLKRLKFDSAKIDEIGRASCRERV